MAIETGSSATLRYIVEAQHTAAILGSGDVEVLGTPQVVAWCEAVTVAAVERSLAADDTTVGTEVRVEHLRPTPVGGSVRVDAILTEVDGRRLTFDVSAYDDRGEIATGHVARMVVNRTRFIERVTSD